MLIVSSQQTKKAIEKNDNNLNSDFHPVCLNKHIF